MTIREYVSQKLNAFNITEATFADVMYALNMDLEQEYTFDIAPEVGKAIAQVIEELILAPRLSSVSEGGVSMSWDYADLGKYYLYLCNKWGLCPNEEVIVISGISVIVDRTNIW